VLATLTVVARDRDVAADATDEAFIRAYARWAAVRSMASPVGWTVRVGINVVRRRHRRRAIEQRLLRREVPRPDAAAPAGEMWDAVHRLPERQRHVVLLRYVADLPELEIADALGVSRSAVSSALTEARRRLLVEIAHPDEEVRHVERTS
jgi:RNA polymerase sigma-70 factor (ECF subfamily)